MPAVVEVMVAVEATVDVELEISLVPTLGNIDVSDNLLFFKIVLIFILNQILVLDLNLIHPKISFLLQPILFLNTYSLVKHEVMR